MFSDWLGLMIVLLGIELREAACYRDVARFSFSEMETWRKVFYIISLVLLIGGLFLMMLV